jgi:peptidoglycan hydrolase CwlO-like protein
MSKPVTPNEMFDLWQKMVNPGGYPLQSLMFPVPDVKELDKKISELETVEHWLRANLNMLQMTIKTLQYQKDLLAPGEKARASATPSTTEEAMANPAMWAWEMMQKGAQSATEMANKAADSATKAVESGTKPKPKAKRGK